MEEYGDDVYRPGEDFDWDTLTDEEKSERRKEIEEEFARARGEQ